MFIQLATVVPRIIYKNQFSFIKGRSIHSNFMLVQMMAKSLRICKQPEVLLEGEREGEWCMARMFCQPVKFGGLGVRDLQKTSWSLQSPANMALQLSHAIQVMGSPGGTGTCTTVLLVLKWWSRAGSLDPPHLCCPEHPRSLGDSQLGRYHQSNPICLTEPRTNSCSIGLLLGSTQLDQHMRSSLPERWSRLCGDRTGTVQHL